VNSAPRLTIGLPVYNGENFLAESIEALLGQTYEDFELVISDNASTDSTPEICRRYGRQDSRIRYIRQPHNIGLNPNHNFVVRQARGELFKMASHDDLYARDLLQRCVAALDAHPEVVVAHCWEAVVDPSGTVTKLLDYSVATDAPRAPDRLRSLLFDGWDDYTYGVMRTQVLMRTRLHGSHHFADRTINTELCLHGPFYLVPEWLYFRRDHLERKEPYTVRSRCAYLDPRRADRLRNPVVRLYGEYIWAYITAIHNAPISAADKLACHGHLTKWLAGRSLPAVNRSLSGGALQAREFASAVRPDISVDALVAGRAGRAS
jgi:glycosyltransferase involved in cell wall biosynthesis